MKIYTCLVGDLFHAGHVNYLKKCRELGDFLLVGVASDDDVALYKRKPIMNYWERLQVVAGCRYIDQIFLSPPPSVITDDFIDDHEIDLVVHGDDSNEDQLRHFYGAAMERGMYKSIGYTHGISTTEIIQRIRDRSDSEVDRRNFLC